MNTLSYKTKYASNESVERQWFVVDAQGMTLGRLCTRIATVLRGKHKPSYTPHIDTGDYVIVLNSDKVVMTGNKWDQKEYIRYSGYQSGQKRENATLYNQKRPTRVVENAVRGMLPKNRLGRAMFKKLFVYQGADHPHAAQKPAQLTF